MAGSVGQDGAFFTSRDGLFKILQFALSLLVLILCSASGYWGVAGAGTMAFVHFTSSTCCITLFISGFIYFCQIYNSACIDRLPWKLLEMGYAVGCGILYFISMCISASMAATFANVVPHSYKNLFIACAVFSVVTMFSFLAYALIIFRGAEPKSAKQQHQDETVPSA